MLAGLAMLTPFLVVTSCRVARNAKTSPTLLELRGVLFDDASSQHVPILGIRITQQGSIQSAFAKQRLVDRVEILFRGGMGVKVRKPHSATFARGLPAKRASRGIHLRGTILG
jgi:hypothetical protein